MSDFSDQWLALRAAADSRARADQLVRRLRIKADEHLNVLDLGCGTGANLRHLAPLLAAAGAVEQHWTCADHAETLLARLAARTADWAAAQGHRFTADDGSFRIRASDWHCRVQTETIDLAAGLASVPMPTGALMTASALLDLVSAAWLDGLLARCRQAQCRLLFTLSYDGRCALEPAHADDAAVITLVNRHQRGDKGFGPALGPAAASHAKDSCSALGYQAHTADSDWRIGPDEADFQQALVDGWYRAAREAAPESDSALAARLTAWREARAGWIDAGRSRIIVGHRDLAAARPEPVDAIDTATPETG
jgi:SAM-dependent methyltransferase